MTDGSGDDLCSLFAYWPETRHLGARLKLLWVERGGSAEICVDTDSLIPVLEEFVVISETCTSTEMHAVAEKIRRMLPTIKAFDADPNTVMESGVN